MDWTKVKADITHATTAPPLVLLETCWRIQTPSGKIVTCGIYRTDGPGLELRAGYSEDDLLRSQRVPEIGVARAMADDWKRSVLAKGSFIELR